MTKEVKFLHYLFLEKGTCVTLCMKLIILNGWMDGWIVFSKGTMYIFLLYLVIIKLNKKLKHFFSVDVIAC